MGNPRAGSEADSKPRHLLRRRSKAEPLGAQVRGSHHSGRNRLGFCYRRAARRKHETNGPETPVRLPQGESQSSLSLTPSLATVLHEGDLHQRPELFSQSQTECGLVQENDSGGILQRNQIETNSVRLNPVRTTRFYTPLLALLIMFLVTNPLLAGPTATVTGRVTDPSGGVIAGVKVEATNVETNVTFLGETNAEGMYSIPNLPPGIYRVIVMKFAFRTVVKPDVELHVQDVVALNFSMELGSVTQSVTVEAGAPLIQATPARGGNFLS